MHARAQEYLQTVAAITAATSSQDVVAAVELLFAAWQRGATIYLCGNGGSASTATHFAADLAKAAWIEGRRPIHALSLCDNAPLISAITNDWGFHRVFTAQLEARFQQGDVLVAISVHGGVGSDQAGPWSTNLVAAAQYAAERGGHVLAFVGFDGGRLKQLADVSIVVPESPQWRLSTPHVEGVHVVIHHLVCELLRERIATEGERPEGGSESRT